MTNHTSNYEIGIEITRIFLHIASTRLKNLTNYAQDVLAGKVKKDDRKFLRTEQIILNPDKPSEEAHLNAVLYNHPPVTEYLPLLEKSIQDKLRKYESYPELFNKLELIVRDGKCTSIDPFSPL